MITITYDKTKHPKDFVLAQNSVKYNDYSGNVFDNELIELWKSEASKSNATIKFYTLWKDKDLLPTRIIYKKHNIILHGYWYCNDRIVQDYPILQSHNKECVSYKCINDIVTLTYDLDKWIELYEKAKEKKKRITIDDYRRCLYSHKPLILPMNVIRSHKHELCSETINKVALSAADDKRVIQADLISTLAIGHYKLRV